MNGRARALLFTAAGFGAALEVCAVAWLARGNAPEINLLGALPVFILGAILSMGALEYGAEQKGRSRAWALIALLGPAGPAALALLRPRTGAAPRETAPRAATRSRADRLVGGGLVLLVTVGFLWAAAEWFRLDDWPRKPSPAAIPGNEAKAFERMQQIAEAQERYRQKDWDDDGEKSYARFMVHLWRTADTQGNPVEVNLVPRRLGFAMDYSLALDGYFYIDLRQRGQTLDRARPLDAAREWAVAAIPKAYRSTGILSFMVDQSGKIYAKDDPLPWPTRYPENPESGGWTEVSGKEALPGR